MFAFVPPWVGFCGTRWTEVFNDEGSIILCNVERFYGDLGF